MRRTPVSRLVSLLLLITCGVVGSAAGHDARHGENAERDREWATPIRITMEALHAHGGVPPGWVFAIPAGNAVEGREVFRTMECFASHAESVVNPNRVIVLGPGHTGADGLSTMPGYAESLTLQQLVDVVAYLRSLTGLGAVTPTAGGPVHRH
jgi:hypothetical protein